MTTTADDVWQLLAELTRKQAELTEAQKETDRQLKETSLELKHQTQETDRQIREVQKQIGNLGGKWGRFVENMVAPACETLFLQRGILVHQVSQRIKKRRNGETLEVDILVTNENYVLMVEVKSTLGVDDIKTVVQDLGRFRDFFPEYAQKTLYGAVAGIDLEAGAAKYAYRQGLFILAQSGETVSILNADNFQPKNW